MAKQGLMVADRLKALRGILERKGFARIIEAHSGLSGIVGDTAGVEVGGEIFEYDGLWESSLTDSAIKGLPDASIVGVESRLHTIDEILNVTSKPLIVDGDTGGDSTQFEYLVRQLERRGVSAVIIEDKVFPKRNSLDASGRHKLEEPKVFAEKIQRGKRGAHTDEFMIIARLESLIAGSSLEDALERAETYIRAEVDGIMIHSYKNQPDEILSFAGRYETLCEKLGSRPTLVCVPTTYNLITFRELVEHGFNIVIYANHLLRSSFKAMEEAALSILAHDRSFEVEALSAPTSKIFGVVGYESIKIQDQLEKDQRYSIIIPAAGKDPVFDESPKAMIKIGGQTILDHQIDKLRKAGLTDNRFVVIRGHEGDQFTRTDVEYRDNPEYLDTHNLYSLFCAESFMSHGFLLLYSDILFDEKLIERLVDSGGDIVLLIDNSYRYHKHEVDKKLELVVGSRQYPTRSRRLRADSPVIITQVGKEIPGQLADYEFVGIAFFSKKGSETLQKVYQDAKSQGAGLPFHESPTFEQATVLDVIQEIINRGFPVFGQELSGGWIEIHNRLDISRAEEELNAARANYG